MKIVYIAGPYGNPKTGYHKIDRNIAQAREAADWLANLGGIGYFCPHLNSAHFEVIAPDVDNDYWLEMDKEILRRCDAILMIQDWNISKGAMAELDLAQDLGLRCFFCPLDKQLANEILEWSRA